MSTGSRGHAETFVTRPIGTTRLALSMIVLVVVIVRAIRKKPEEVFPEENQKLPGLSRRKVHTERGRLTPTTINDLSSAAREMGLRC